ncbi:MAG TPA: hypothetical protein VIE65_09450 [Methylobacter sp.]
MANIEDSLPSPEVSHRKRIEIRIPEQLKVTSDEVWEDLEAYLFIGFLTSHAKLMGKSFVFKTLNHTEVQGISHLRPAGGSSVEVQQMHKAAFIAHSIFYIDGQSALYERPRYVNRLINSIKKFPEKVQDEIIVRLGALNEKASRLHPLTEVYIHENRSRFKWLQLKSSLIHSAAITGIPGTDLLGMNYCQQAWTALNHLIDQREAMEADWQNAKFIGSCFNGKGVRSVDERDKGRREKERDEREEKKLKVLFRYLNRLPPQSDGPPSEVTLPDGRVASVVKTFKAESHDELAAQLSSALSGEKDYHDQVVEAKVRQNAERRSALQDLSRLVYSAPPLPDTERPANRYASASLPAAGASRILGGREAAEALLARMQAMRLDGAERARQQAVSINSQNSDESIQEEKRKA